MKIDSETLHLMRLAAKGADVGGWARVSGPVWPLLERIPAALIEKEATEVGGRCRLTDEGKIVLEYS